MARYKREHLRHITAHRKNKARAATDGRWDVTPCPTKPDGMTWRDYLIELLHIGAELEHGLMVQYLYAAYSLGGDNVPPEDQTRVREWQDLILTVAREEMGHLMTVQNLLVLVGGPVWFNREDFPWDTPFYPFPFRLEPLSKHSLAAYIFAEMPHNFEYLESHRDDSIWGDRARHFVDHDIPFIKKTVKKWVEEDYARPVGEVYQLVIDIFANPEFIPDSDLRPETYPLQASWDDWGRSYGPKPAPPSGKPPPVNNQKANVIIERAATRTEALYALREIMGQGEAAGLKSDQKKLKEKQKDKKKKHAGAPDVPTPPGELSHFERFVEIFQAFEEKAGSRAWNPVRAVPVNPTTSQESLRSSPRGPDFRPTPISAQASLRWANLFNVRYRMLLTYLTHTFRLGRSVHPDEANLRGAVMHRIFGEMYNLKAIAGILVCMPLTDRAGDPRRAGPTFQMPYSIELPPDDIDCWRMHRDIVLCSVELCDELLDPSRNQLAVTPPEGEPYLSTLRNLDRQALAWIDSILGGLRDNQGKRP